MKAMNSEDKRVTYYIGDVNFTIRNPLIHEFPKLSLMTPKNRDNNGNYRFDFEANNYGRITKTRKSK